MSFFRFSLTFQSLLHSLLSFLFPSLCIACGRLSEPLCVRCRDQIFFRPHLRQIEALCVASGLDYAPHSLLENLLHGFKYQHQADLLRYFVPPMRETLRLLMEPRELVLVPVPLFAARQNDRGYNQSELLARALQRQTGCGVALLLERVRSTGQQAHLETRAERFLNVQGAFRISPTAPPLSKDCPLVLLDDIVTSGSTLLTCREVLLKAGYSQVHALTLADRVLA